VRRAIVGGLVGLVVLLSGCTDDSASKAQDTLNHETPVWSCINNGGTWSGSTDTGSCK